MILRFTPESAQTVTIVFSLDGLTAAAIDAGLNIDYYNNIDQTVEIGTYSIRSCSDNPSINLSLNSAGTAALTYFAPGNFITANGTWVRNENRILIEFDEEDLDTVSPVFRVPEGFGGTDVLYMNNRGVISFTEPQLLEILWIGEEVCCRWYSP